VGFGFGNELHGGSCFANLEDVEWIKVILPRGGVGLSKK
jgi:hypothetical protein